MATFTFKHEITGTLGNEEKVFQGPSTDATLDLDDILDRPRVIPFGATVTLWDNTSALVPTTFDFFYFLTDGDCTVEFRVSSTTFSLTAAAGIPLMLGSDTGNGGLINRIRATSLSVDTDANVRYAVGV